MVAKRERRRKRKTALALCYLFFQFLEGFLSDVFHLLYFCLCLHLFCSNIIFNCPIPAVTTGLRCFTDGTLHPGSKMYSDLSDKHNHLFLLFSQILIYNYYLCIYRAYFFAYLFINLTYNYVYL